MSVLVLRSLVSSFLFISTDLAKRKFFLNKGNIPFFHACRSASCYLAKTLFFILKSPGFSPESLGSFGALLGIPYSYAIHFDLNFTGIKNWSYLRKATCSLANRWQLEPCLSEGDAPPPLIHKARGLTFTLFFHRLVLSSCSIPSFLNLPTI